MNLFFWNTTKKVDRFAQATADELFSGIQPELAQTVFSKPSQSSKDTKRKKLTAADRDANRQLENLIDKIRRFKQIEKLGVYSKARLHMKFMQRLEALGYPEDIVKRINEVIMLKTP